MTSVNAEDTTNIEVKPIIGNEQMQQVASVLELKLRLAFFKRMHLAANSRKDRLEDLMQRKIAKTWDAAKKAKMVRRLVSANKVLEQSVMAVDIVEQEIEKQLAQPAPPTASAPYVPPPPTSA